LNKKPRTSFIKVVDNNSGEGSVAGDFGTLVKPGIYELGFKYHQTAVLFGKAKKLILCFEFTEYGNTFGLPIARYYNVQGFKGKVGRNGKFIVGNRSAFIREFGILFGKIKNPKFISINQFKGVTIKGKIKTVTRSYDGGPIPEGQEYSVIERLICLKEI